jgi:membrane fusion protein, multidrug efflux system
MKKILVSAVVVAAVGLGYLAWHQPSRADQAAPARVAPAPEVAVVTMQEKEVRLTSELPGRTAVYQVAEIRPQVGGIIQHGPLPKERRSNPETCSTRSIRPPMTWPWPAPRPPWPRAKAELEPARLKAARYRDLIRTKGRQPAGS